MKKQFNLTLRNGNQYWYLDTEDRSDDVLSGRTGVGGLHWHRTDGPAAIYIDGRQTWWVNNKRHRTDGPAIVYADGRQEWYLNGKKITNDYDLSLFDSEEGRMILILKY